MLCTRISIDWCLLQNCWQPNFIHVMLKSRCWKILETSSRSWRRTVCRRLHNPAKERKNSLTIFLVKLKRLKQSKNFAVTLICAWPFSVFARCAWKRWKWHTDADEIVKLQREFGRRFQDFWNLESGIKTVWNCCWISANKCPNGIVVLNRGGTPPRGESINFQVAQALTCFRTWKLWSRNLPINTFAFTAYLKSGGLKQRTIT